MAKSSINETRQKEAVKRKQRRRNLIIGGAIAACALIIALVIILQPRPLAFTRSANADVVIKAADVKSGLNYVDYGGSEELILWRDGNGGIRTALDTCEECFGGGDVHYTLSGSNIVCSACQTTQDVTILGSAAWGGCQPVAIPVAYRADTDADIVIPAEVLAFAEDVFTHWGEADYTVSMAQYGDPDWVDDPADGGDHDHDGDGIPDH